MEQEEARLSKKEDYAGMRGGWRGRGGVREARGGGFDGAEEDNEAGHDQDGGN